MATFEKFPIAPTLPASDIERAKRWYKEKLGLTPNTELPGGAGLLYTAGENPMGFILYESEFAGTAENTAVAWAVENIDIVTADLRSRGVRFEEYDAAAYRTEKGIASDEAGGKAAWFKDSEGNILNLFQLPAGVAIDARSGGQATTRQPGETYSDRWSEEPIEEREPVGTGTPTI